MNKRNADFLNIKETPNTDVSSEMKPVTSVDDQDRIPHYYATKTEFLESIREASRAYVSKCVRIIDLEGEVPNGLQKELVKRQLLAMEIKSQWKAFGQKREVWSSTGSTGNYLYGVTSGDQDYS